VSLDTNVLVSAFAVRGMCSDCLRVVMTEHTSITSEVVLVELARVLRTKIGVPARTVNEIEALLREHEVAPRPRAASELPIGDPDDRWVLASAIDAGAEVVVTGDRDLLEVAARSPVRIVSPREFWELIRKP
jgi:putative PIN family toxin of toxin-antitoxin system